MPSINFDLKDIKPFLGTLGLGQAPDAKLPDVGNLPVPAMPPPAPPPPPQPTPAQAGFEAWAGDPQNQSKVAKAITAPGQPILPPAPAPAPVAAAPAPAPGLPSVQPLAGMGGPVPQVSAGLLPYQPGNPMQAKLDTDTAELGRLQRNGAGLNGIKNPWLRTLARIGDVAGTILAPGVASALPGTTVHNWTLQNLKQGQVAGDQQQLKDAAALADTQSQMEQRQAFATKSLAQADALGDPAKLKAQQVAKAAALGMTPQYDDGGTLTGWATDPNSPITKSRVAKDALVTAQTQVAGTSQQLKAAQAEFERSRNDPNSPQLKLAQQKLAVAMQGHQAAMLRAQAAWGNYQMHSRGVGLDGAVLPGAEIITGDDGTQRAVGTALAGAASKGQAKAAQFNDVSGSLDHLDGALQHLRDTGGRLNSPAVIAALQDHSTPTAQWVQSQAAAALSPQERDAVVAVKSTREQIMALRSSVGGGVSDSQVNRLVDQLPGASTPDYDMASRQINVLRSSVSRLAPGVSTAAGGITIHALPHKGAGVQAGAAKSGKAADPLGIR